MTEREFLHNLREAEELKRVSQTPETSFWEGYLRGLKRNCRGERFVTDQEHDIWMQLKNEPLDDDRRYYGIGYEMGFNGNPTEDAIRYIQPKLEEKGGESG